MTEIQYGRISAIDKPISRLVQGTAFFTPQNKDADMALMDAVFELGCTAFDTGHVYGNGASERILGEWMERNGNREQIVIVSKCAHPNQDRRRVTSHDIWTDLHDSLARLRTDTIDIYLLHRDDEAVPAGEIVEAMNDHLRSGKILAYGGSNWTVARIAEANHYAAEKGLVGMAASSSQFSLAEAVKEPWPGCLSISGERGRPSRAWYAEHNMPVFSWSSLAGGFLSGRFTPDNLNSFTNYYDRICVSAFCYPQNFEKLERAKSMAAEKSLTLPQLGLAYIFSQPLDLYAIIGSRSGEEYAANRTGLNTRLTAAEVAWLENGTPA